MRQKRRDRERIEIREREREREREVALAGDGREAVERAEGYRQLEQCGKMVNLYYK